MGTLKSAINRPYAHVDENQNTLPLENKSADFAENFRTCKI